MWNQCEISGIFSCLWSLCRSIYSTLVLYPFLRATGVCFVSTALLYKNMLEIRYSLGSISRARRSGRSIITGVAFVRSRRQSNFQIAPFSGISGFSHVEQRYTLWWSPQCGYVTCSWLQIIHAYPKLYYQKEWINTLTSSYSASFLALVRHDLKIYFTDKNVKRYIYTNARVDNSYTPYGHHLELARGERHRQLSSPLRALPK